MRNPASYLKFSTKEVGQMYFYGIRKHGGKGAPYCDWGEIRSKPCPHTEPSHLMKAPDRNCHITNRPASSICRNSRRPSCRASKYHVTCASRFQSSYGAPAHGVARLHRAEQGEGGPRSKTIVAALFQPATGPGVAVNPECLPSCFHHHCCYSFGSL